MQSETFVPSSVWGSSEVVHAADPPGQLNVAWKQRHSFGVDGTQVGIRKKQDEEGLCSLKDRRDG